jgi:hypothetical protein
MSDDLQRLIGQLRSPNYREQAAAADQLGEFANPLAEAALLDCFAGNTYQLIDQDGSPGRYHAIVLSAARALARLNTEKAFGALVTKARSNSRSDQLGIAAAVSGLSYSQRLEVADIIRAVTPQLDADGGSYLAQEIKQALERIESRVACSRPIVWPRYVRWLAVAYWLSRLVGPGGFIVMQCVVVLLILRDGPRWEGPIGVASAAAWACLLGCAAFRRWFVNWGRRRWPENQPADQPDASTNSVT